MPGSRHGARIREPVGAPRNDGVYFLYAAITASPSGPAFFDQSAVNCLPIFSRPAFNAGGGGSTFILLAVRCSRYHFAFSSASFQPRSSATAAAFRIASWVGLSSAAKAALFTKVWFFGIQAC